MRRLDGVGRGCGQRGVAAVEMAVIVPLFLMLMLGVAELGRACYEYNTLTKAVRLAARHLAEHALNDAGVLDLESSAIAESQNLAVYGNPVGEGEPLLTGLSTGDVSIAAPDAMHVQVSVDYDYVPLFAVIPTFEYADEGIASVGTMNAVSTMRAL